jgi:hypothetical protein
VPEKQYYKGDSHKSLQHEHCDYVDGDKRCTQLQERKSSPGLLLLHNGHEWGQIGIEYGTNDSVVIMPIALSQVQCSCSDGGL